MPLATRAAIDDFLQQKRIAIAGVSRRPQDFSRMMLREFLHHGYDALPVNPYATEFDGIPVAGKIGDIHPPPDAVLLMTSPELADELVRECAVAGVRRVWMHRGIGNSTLSANAREFCRQNGITVIAGECPFMYLPDTGAIHRIHRFFRQLAGSLPR
jgi:predicted CoA-binding protein